MTCTARIVFATPSIRHAHEAALYPRALHHRPPTGGCGPRPHRGGRNRHRGVEPEPPQPAIPRLQGGGTTRSTPAAHPRGEPRRATYGVTEPRWENAPNCASSHHPGGRPWRPRFMDLAKPAICTSPVLFTIQPKAGIQGRNKTRMVSSAVQASHPLAGLHKILVPNGARASGIIPIRPLRQHTVCQSNHDSLGCLETWAMMRSVRTSVVLTASQTM